MEDCKLAGQEHDTAGAHGAMVARLSPGSSRPAPISTTRGAFSAPPGSVLPQAHDAGVSAGAHGSSVRQASAVSAELTVDTALPREVEGLDISTYGRVC